MADEEELTVPEYVRQKYGPRGSGLTRSTTTRVSVNTP